jgi:6-phosphogluconolactonase (cycloisomerase 2 family)
VDLIYNIRLYSSYSVRRRLVSTLLLAGSAVVLVQCESGSRVATPVTQADTTQPDTSQPDTTQSIGSEGKAKTAALAPLTVRVAIPRPRRVRLPRSPKYITSATASIEIDITSPSVGATTTNVSAGTAPCATVTASDYVCTLTVQAPPGSDSLTISAYDGSNASGNLISQQRTVASIARGEANSLSLTLDANSTSASIGPPSGVTLSGNGCPGTVVSGSSDLSATCTATFSGTGVASFSVAAVDVDSVPIPASAPGAPVLTATSGSPGNFAVSTPGNGSFTITPQAAASAGSGATSKISLTVTPADSAGSNPGDGLTPFTLSFTVAAPSAAAQFFYVTNSGNNSVEKFPNAANGSVSPTSTLSGAATGLDTPNYAAFDASGKMYVANVVGTVTVYAAGATGNAAPIATIAGSNTGLSQCQTVALDSSGKIYVTNNSPDSVTVYAAGANGNVAPVATIAGSNTGLSTPIDVVLDSRNNIYVTNADANSVTEYAAGANGNVSPILTLAGSNTMINDPTGVSFDGAGRTFVTNSGNNSITIYPAGASGNTAPTAVISGSNTGLNEPEVAIFSPSGNIYVPNYNGNSITVYAGTATGNATPTATLSGSNTGLNAPTSVTFH